MSRVATTTDTAGTLVSDPGRARYVAVLAVASVVLGAASLLSLAVLVAELSTEGYVAVLAGTEGLLALGAAFVALGVYAAYLAHLARVEGR